MSNRSPIRAAIGQFVPSLLVALLAVVGCASPPAPAGPAAGGGDGTWPQWRGPARDGAVPDPGIALDWETTTPRELWRRPIGEGYSSVIAAGDRIYTLDCDERNEYLLALDAGSGRRLWRLDLGRRFDSSRGNGPRSTPALDGGTIYTLSALGDLHAVRAGDGDPLWHVKLSSPPSYGYAASPLIDGDRLYVFGHLDSEDAVLAFDKESGEPLWSALPAPLGYASPLIAELAGRRQLLAMLGDRVAGLDPGNGEVLWSHPWRTSYRVNAADPLAVPPDGVFVSSSYDQGAALLRVAADASSGAAAVTEVWRSRVMKNHFHGSVIAGDHVYGFDNATLKCVALSDGEECWKKRGFGKGSLIRAGDHLLVFGERGALALVEATPDAYRELGRVDALAGRSWTSPSLAGSRLYLRNQQRIVALDLGAP